MKIEEYKRLLEVEDKAPKYHNKKVKFRGLTFDSLKERDYYIFLLGEEKKGQIRGLERQVPLEIQPEFITPQGEKIRPINYIADFVYTDNEGERHIVDTKGFRTDVYKLKKKLLAYRGIYIEEV